MRSRIARRALLSFTLTLCAAASARGQASINLPPTEDLPTFTTNALWGQSFVALGSAAEQLTFYMRMRDAYTVPLAFQLLLTTIVPNPVLPPGKNDFKPGAVIFESAVQTLPVGADLTAFTIDLGSVPLTPGVTYAWMLDSRTPANDGFSGGVLGAARNGTSGTPADDAYPDGRFFFSICPSCTDRASMFASSNWENLVGGSDYRDMAFDMQFSGAPVTATPEPSTLLLLTSGLGAIAARRRRTRQTN
jgi:hypothetical protein